MKTTIFIFTCFVCFLFASCKKDDAKNVSDCEKSNFGTLKVSYASSAVRHSILITQAGSMSAREKISPIGQSSDTVHLSPATYGISISSINDAGLAMDQQTEAVTVNKCDEINKSVKF